MVCQHDARSTRRCFGRWKISHQVLTRDLSDERSDSSFLPRIPSSAQSCARESSSFLARSLGFYMAVLSRRVFNRGIDLPPKQNGQPGDIEPQHKNDDGAQ